MIRVYGCNVSEQHARWIVASLQAGTSADAHELAGKISNALATRSSAGQLTPGMRDALLGVLTAPLHSGLTDLRGALVRDHRARG